MPLWINWLCSYQAVLRKKQKSEQGGSFMQTAKRRFPRFPAVLLMFAALLLSLARPALAEEDGESGGETALAALLNDYIQRENIYGDNISIAYYNTVSGEEYLWNGETYFTAASIYKLPLNMYYYDLEAAGELAPDTQIGGSLLSQCHQQSLQYSNNELSELMTARLGTFRQYKALIAKYGGIPEGSLPEIYYSTNSFNTAFILNTLKIFYGGREGVYAQAVEYLKDANPDRWFETGVPDSECVIAQKYGWLSTEYYTVLHAAGIVYADEPFLLVVFTRNVPNAEQVLGGVARLCYDYTQANLNAWRTKVLGYKDVFTTDWYAEAVAYCSVKGIINGTPDMRFSPEDGLTRAMFVTMLGRLSGVDGAGSFADVDYGAYYSFYVEWAYKNGIVQGVDETNFAPNAVITREQAAVMLYRYLTAQGFSLPAEGGAVKRFRDAEEISGYARSAAEALYACGIFEGGGDGRFNPKQNFTRAQAAALFMRMELLIERVKS